MAETVDIDISSEQLRIVREVLSTHLAGYPVYAFGSRARKTARPYSDLDLAIISAHPLTLDQLATVKEAFSESDLPWRVDVIDWNQASLSFKDRAKDDLVWICGGSVCEARE
ncbi:nucleotidyltransferase family protein [Parathalassolituus penaei]|uniref:Nucleotidyltransferase domain-containing protein n=1 Tax=Parathalassolituus penaei TaxID=2997323 RepID=A0A9X3EGI3_9GAMM|nr:nucleotidyltransferase domain-containing protein [Parathalassolituus penaei]MCY0967122.1 nucleotidyltransferase domain-containing protein [Parathalassolituus penaei]